MNKKFLSAILFGALMVTSTGTFVSCKDYDEDIDRIDSELTNIKSQLTALQGKVDAGKYVTGVSASADGILVSFSDGTSTPVSVEGGAVSVTIDPTTKNWLVDGVDTGVCAEGKNAEAPTFSIGEDGHLYVQYGENKEDLGVSTGGIYVVENGPKVTLHVPNADGVYTDVVLPKTAAITEIKALTVGYTDTWYIDNKPYSFWSPRVSEGATVTLYYGKAAAKGTYFDGTEFAKDQILTSQQSVSKLSAQVNPTMADASVYDFYLTDSKGNSYLTLTKATPNETDAALTRAATVNKGVYDMGISFVEGITEAQIKTLSQSYGMLDKDGEKTNMSASVATALAIATKDAYGNEVLSSYNVNVAARTGTSAIATKAVEVEVGKTLDLTSAFTTFENIIDVKYSISTAQTATKDALGVVLNGNLISAEKVGSIVVTVDWMNASGVKTTDTNSSISAKTINVKFVSIKNANTLNVEWTVAKKDGKANVKTLNVNEYTKNQEANTEFKYNANSITYINADGDEVAAPTGAIIPSFSSTDADADGVTDGYWTRTLKYTFDPAKVIPTTYTHVIPYGDNDELTVTIVVKDATDYFDFQVLDAYFNADKTEATAYGIPNGSTIDYDLYKLFNKATNDAAAYITFSEVVPDTYKDADGNEVKANTWLTGTDVTDDDVEWIANAKISVDKADLEESDLIFGGAYAARKISAKYQPYGNANLAPVTMTFDLTIKSEIFEGTIEYVKAVKNADGDQTGWTAGDVKEVDGGKNATLSMSEIVAKDVYGKAYNDYYNEGGTAIKTLLTDDRIADVEVVLADDNAKEYLMLSADDFANGDITISKKSENTAIVTPPTCTVQVKVTDKWNKVKTLDIQVKVVK